MDPKAQSQGRPKSEEQEARKVCSGPRAGLRVPRAFVFPRTHAGSRRRAGRAEAIRGHLGCSDLI